jgi:hypothetical protein
MLQRTKLPTYPNTDPSSRDSNLGCLWLRSPTAMAENRSSQTQGCFQGVQDTHQRGRLRCQLVQVQNLEGAAEAARNRYPSVPYLEPPQKTGSHRQPPAAPTYSTTNIPLSSPHHLVNLDEQLSLAGSPLAVHEVDKAVPLEQPVKSHTSPSGVSLEVARVVFDFEPVIQTMSEQLSLSQFLNSHLLPPSERETTGKTFRRRALLNEKEKKTNGSLSRSGVIVTLDKQRHIYRRGSKLPAAVI